LNAPAGFHSQKGEATVAKREYRRPNRYELVAENRSRHLITPSSPVLHTNLQQATHNRNAVVGPGP
jgi:hypothetical protein